MNEPLDLAWLGPLFGFWWEAVTRVLVPLSSAGLAAGLVAFQIRRATNQRLEDRRAKGVAALERILYSTAATVVGRYDVKTHLERGIEDAGVYSAFPVNDWAVPRWALSVATQVNVDHRLWTRENPEPQASLGSERDAMRKKAMEAADMLLQWLHGDVSLSWFSSADALSWHPLDRGLE